MRLVARAPGKVNLCLFLGPLRPDGRHEVVTLLESVSLADEVVVEPALASATEPAPASATEPAPASATEPAPASATEPAPASATEPAPASATEPAPESATGPPGRPAAPVPQDQVVCPGINELNIVTQTLDRLRQLRWDGPPLRVTINKRIPVAGGMGGGSADAAAALRLASAMTRVSDEALLEIAASLGADVPSQLRPGLVLGTGAGEVIEPVPPLPEHAFVIVPQEFPLSTADVYREADRLGLPRERADLVSRLRDLRAGGPPPAVNDLEPAALSLRPEIGSALDAVRDAGADHAMVSGSGPTVFGVFWGGEAQQRAAAAAGTLGERYPRATCATPVTEEFGAPRGT